MKRTFSPPLLFRLLWPLSGVICLAALILLLWPNVPVQADTAPVCLTNKAPLASIPKASHTIPVSGADNSSNGRLAASKACLPSFGDKNVLQSLQSISSIQCSSNAYTVSDAPPPPFHIPEPQFPVPKTVLPGSDANLPQRAVKDIGKLKRERAVILKKLPADANPAAPKLSGFKSLNENALLATPPYLQQMWNSVLDRHVPEKAFGNNQTLMDNYKTQQWKNITAGWHGMTPDKKLRVINGFFNNWPSKSDMAIYGKTEYWATPEEMMQKGAGDCEDYAISKYLALRYLNWPAKDLWLVLVLDKKKRTHHAVLAARYGSTTFILDNLSKPRYLLIPEDTYMRGYTPFYAINEQSSWIFAMPGKSKHPPPAIGEEQSATGVAQTDVVVKR
jgi:Predicted periplasmic protein